MRDNPFVDLIAILLMLACVLTAGKYYAEWQNKEPPVKEIKQTSKYNKESFEYLHKTTE